MTTQDTSSSRLRVVVVGAGLGGLTAAITFARQGHHVEILERRATFSPVGGAIMIRPNASRILCDWGLEGAFAAVADTVGGTVIRDLVTGDVQVRLPAKSTIALPDWSVSRQTALKVLNGHLVELGVNVKFDTPVSSLSDSNDSDEATVALADGTLLKADLVLVADGVRSHLRDMIMGDYNGPKSPVTTGRTLNQVQVPLEKLRANKLTAPVFGASDLYIWRGEGVHVIGLEFDKGISGCAFNFADEAAAVESDLWSENGDINKVREKMKDSDPALVAFLSMGEGCDRWRLSEMPDIPRWTSEKGRLVLLGDSAHAMIPTAGQGYSQIVEDVEALEMFVASVGAVDLPSMTCRWEAFRKPRVEKVKAFGRANGSFYTSQGKPAGAANGNASGKDKGGAPSAVDINTVEPDREAPFLSPPFHKWLYHYDTVSEAHEYLKQVESGKRTNGRLEQGS